MQLIVNADDFGWSKSINTGIVDAYEKGIVTSTTMLANFSGFDDAVKRHPDGLGLGVHLNLTCERPLTSGRTIQFNGKLSNLIFRKAMLRTVSPEEVKEEFSAQIQKVIDAGFKPTHLDGHRHIHVFPVIRKAFVEVAKDFRISKARLPLEYLNSLSMQGAKNLLIKNMAFPTKKLFEKEKIIYPEKFFGILHTGKLDLFILANEIKKNYSTKEIMCHPGYNEEKDNNFLSKKRKQELDAVTSPLLQNVIKHYNIKLTTFREL